MRAILDTGVFYHPAALRTLHSLGIDAVVPAVAFTERVRQLERDGTGTADRFLESLDKLGFRVEPYGVPQSRRYAVHIKDDAKWRRLARDAMIAGHLEDGDVLWTANPDDFRELGVAKDRLHVVRPGA